MEAKNYESIDEMQEEIAWLRARVRGLEYAGNKMFDCWTVPDIRGFERACGQWAEAVIRDEDEEDA